MHLTIYHFYNPKNYLYSKPVKGLQVCEVDYRFHFNGKEKDNETYGEGNTYDYGERVQDPRLGKWLSLDPKSKEYPQITPYSFSGNNPLYFIDKKGADIIVYFAEDKLKKYPVLVVKTAEFNQTFTLPQGMRETVMSKYDPGQIFPTTPIINTELPAATKSNQTIQPDANTRSLGGEVVAIGGFYASFDLVTINKGDDKGGTFAYLTFGAGFGAEAGVSYSQGITDFFESPSARLSSTAFEGASKIVDGGIGLVGASSTTGYAESDINCPLPFTDCGYTPTYNTFSTSVGTGMEFGAGVYNTQSTKIGTLIKPDKLKSQ
ncbi:MAG: RHS repeat-associated core domain-containing protein [Bacteroidia bacterium]